MQIMKAKVGKMMILRWFPQLSEYDKQKLPVQEKTKE